MICLIQLFKKSICTSSFPDENVPAKTKRVLSVLHEEPNYFFETFT